MAHYATLADLTTQLDAEGATEADLLARFLFDYPEINEACQYNDGVSDRIDVGKAWFEFSRMVLHNPRPGRPGRDETFAEDFS